MCSIAANTILGNTAEDLKEDLNLELEERKALYGYGLEGQNLPLGGNVDDLAGCSPGAKVWDAHKAANVCVREIYIKHDGNEKHVERMMDCAEWLEFYWAYKREAGDVVSRRLRLGMANFCHVRGCPICAWRRSLKMKALALKRLPDILAEYPTFRFLFLTLTVKNCSVENLRSTLSDMSSAWARFRKRDQFQIVRGWFRTTEFTRGQDGVSVHPHYHVVLHVPAHYFSDGYVSQKTWTQIWQECMRVEYNPIIHVKAVPKGEEAQMVKEVMKYCVKEADILKLIDNTSDDWYVRVFEQLRGIKFNTSSGTLKNIASEMKKKKKPTGEENIDEDLITEGEANELVDMSSSLRFDWHQPTRKYKRSK